MSLKKISKEQPNVFEFNEQNLKAVEKAISNYPKNRKKSAVMPLLYIAQKQNNNWIPLSAIKYIAKFLNMPYIKVYEVATFYSCLLYTSPSPRDRTRSRMPSSA